MLAAADGVIAGSALKRDGHVSNPVDPERVRRFMASVKALRG
jgi:predicted TIM-barrel enzyme